MTNKNSVFIESNPESDAAIKYNSKNYIVRKLVADYTNTFNSLLSEITDVNNILEVGAGEGFWSKDLAIKFPDTKIISSDISNNEYATRKKNLHNFKNVSVIKADATNLKFKDECFDLVICLEVIEHIPNYDKALSEIFRVNKKFGLFSVPNEPIWSLLNLCRGKYFSRMGNTPDHFNRWSKNSFSKLLQNNGYRIRYTKTPLPWTMILVEK